MTLRRLELATSWGPLNLAGGSRAGEATLLLLPQLRLALDAGRAHRALPPMSTLLVSHGHADHLGGLGYWASQRELGSMGPGAVLAPAPVAPKVDRLLHALADLEGGRPYPVEVVGVSSGSVHPLRRDVDLHVFETTHWVPTVGARLRWTRRVLRPDLEGTPADELAALRRSGEEISVPRPVDILAYCADCTAETLDLNPELYRTEILLVECSFFAPADRDRAARYGHVHLEDLVQRADRFANRHLILLHPSRRQRLKAVEAAIARRLAPRVAPKVHHLGVDWE